ncbi:MAG: hypothetical protein IPJ98_24570 [Bryobacterales bacterium]|nr:hypothetical protein [Bryobacterales bacterium]
MNKRTTRMLAAIGEKNDSAGAVALSRLIGMNGIRHSFDLDVYSQTAVLPGVKKQKSLLPRLQGLRDVGLKSETDSIGLIASNRIRIAKKHNQLTNRLREWLLWRHQVPKESKFDALILDWRQGRHLLIEAKTASTGPGGRAQLRQAIGQLFDYRHTYSGKLPPGKIDLAVLLPSKPSEDVLALLGSLDIGVLWFEGKDLKGTSGIHL